MAEALKEAKCGFCTTCARRKPLDEMCKSRPYRCLLCGRRYFRERYKKNDQVRAVQYRWRDENRERVNEQTRQRRRKNPEKRLYELAKRRANRTGLPFSIQLSDVVVPATCPVLGIALGWKEFDGKRGFPHPGSPTLDRLDSSKGYVPENVEVISWRANSLKKDGTLEELEKLVKWMKRRLRA